MGREQCRGKGRLRLDGTDGGCIDLLNAILRQEPPLSQPVPHAPGKGSGDWHWLGEAAWGQRRGSVVWHAHQLATLGSSESMKMSSAT